MVQTCREVGPVDISVEGHWGWSWQTAGLEKEREEGGGGWGFMGDVCCFSLVHYFLPPVGRLCRTWDGRSGRSTFSPAAAKAHLSSIHTNQVLHKTLAQTSLCRQIASAANAPSASLPLLCFSVLFFSVCLPASCLPSFSSDFVYCDFWPPFLALSK